MVPVEAGPAVLRVRRETLHDGGAVVGEADEGAGGAAAGPDPAERPRAPGARVTVPVTRPTHRRRVGVLHVRTAGDAPAVRRAQVTTSPTLMNALQVSMFVSDMELGHSVTGSMGHLGHLSRPGHRFTRSSF